MSYSHAEEEGVLVPVQIGSEIKLGVDWDPFLALT